MTVGGRVLIAFGWYWTSGLATVINRVGLLLTCGPNAVLVSYEATECEMYAVVRANFTINFNVYSNTSDAATLETGRNSLYTDNRQRWPTIVIEHHQEQMREDVNANGWTRIAEVDIEGGRQNHGWTLHVHSCNFSHPMQTCLWQCCRTNVVCSEIRPIIPLQSPDTMVEIRMWK